MISTYRYSSWDEQRWQIVICFFIPFACMLAAPVGVQAATIVVDSLDDFANRGCTLRQAITAANNNKLVPGCAADGSFGADLITFSVRGTITLEAELTITDPGGLTINGPASGDGVITISGRITENAHGPFRVETDASLTLKSLVIADSLDSAIVNLGRLTIIDSQLLHNRAQDAGGAISNTGNLTITGSQLANNSAKNGGGGIFNVGTAILTNCMLLSNTVDNNSNTILGSSGGGIFNGFDGNVTIINSWLKGNSATNGGAVSNVGAVEIINTTLSENSAIQEGGAIVNGGVVAVDTHAFLSIMNSTIFNNSANRIGGGLYNVSPTGESFDFVDITYTTIAKNTPDGIGGSVNRITMTSSILANSPRLNCQPLPGLTSPRLGDHDFNIEDGSSCLFLRPNSRSNLDPLLDTQGLNNHGGPTPTIALQAGSPARDFIPNGTILCPSEPLTDQNGFVRPAPVQGNCDIGAFEVGMAPEIVNSMVSFVALPGSFPGDVPQSCSFSFGFRAKLTNKSSSPLTRLLVRVNQLTNNALIVFSSFASSQTTVLGAGGVGLTFPIPLVGDYADGILSPGKELTMSFLICPNNKSLFRFTVDVLGNGVN